MTQHTPHFLALGLHPGGVAMRPLVVVADQMQDTMNQIEIQHFFQA